MSTFPLSPQIIFLKGERRVAVLGGLEGTPWPSAAMTVNGAETPEHRVLNWPNLGCKLWALGRTWPTIVFGHEVLLKYSMVIHLHITTSELQQWTVYGPQTENSHCLTPETGCQSLALNGGRAPRKVPVNTCY